MPDDENLTPPPPPIPDALAFALRFQGRKRVHNADEVMSVIVAEQLVEHLERCGFLIMKKPPLCEGGPSDAGSRVTADSPRPRQHLAKANKQFHKRKRVTLKRLRLIPALHGGEGTSAGRFSPLGSVGIALPVLRHHIV